MIISSYMKSIHTSFRWLVLLFCLSLAAAVLHYVDNIWHLQEYPDLPTVTAYSILRFFVIMISFGLIGMWLYVKNKLPYAFYSLYVYCAMNLVVLGHYLPSRIHTHGGVFAPRVHVLIWLEVLTTVVLLLYVLCLQAKTSSGKIRVNKTGRG